MKLGALIGGMVGLGLSAWLLASFGVGRILAVLGHAGWFAIPALMLFHVPQMMFSALGWREIAGVTVPRPAIRTYVLLRWIRESVNNLLPLAQIGGEFAAARSLHKLGMRLATAIAATAADLSIEMISQIVFTLFGLILLIQGAGNSGIAGYVLSGVVGAAVLIACLFGAMRFGFASMIERGLIKLGRSLGWAGMDGVEGLHEALLARYRSPPRVALSILYHLISWLLGGIEVCLALHFLGADVDIRTGMVIESLGQALKTVGFAVPGALGVQEGGYIVVCRVFGLSPEVAIALSLMKRLREVALGLPGLMLGQFAERKAAARTASRSEAVQ
jgi:putative membrane protein